MKNLYYHTVGTGPSQIVTYFVYYRDGNTLNNIITYIMISVIIYLGL